MDDAKRTYREGEQDTKKAWRDADGHESLSDKVGNVGDEARKDLGNAGDDLTGGDTGYGGTNPKAEWRKSDGDESVADKVGNAGDNIRNEMNR